MLASNILSFNYKQKKLVQDGKIHAGLFDQSRKFYITNDRYSTLSFVVSRQKIVYLK